MNTFAQTVLGLAVVLSGIIVFALVYPHNHHDTQWLTSRPEWNYRVDVAIGVSVAVTAVVAWIARGKRVRVVD